MAPRKKVNTDAAAVAAQDAAAKAAQEAQQKLMEELRAMTPADLIKTYRDLEEWMAEQSKKLAEVLAPWIAKNNSIKAVLLQKADEQKVNSFPTDNGTAYISEGVGHKVDPNSPHVYTNPETGEIATGREALLDWMMDHWNDYGAEHAQIGIASKGVEAYMAATKSEENPNGVPPPGITLEPWRRMNVRKK